MLFGMPEEKFADFFNKLNTEKLTDGTTYLNTIVRRMDKTDLQSFSQWQRKALFKKNNLTVENANTVTDTYCYYFGIAKSGSSELATSGTEFSIKAEINDKGQIVIYQNKLQKSGRNPAISIADASPRSLSPNDYVLVRFYDDYTYGLETIVNKGTSIYVPALTLWAMVQEKSARDLSFGFKAVGFFISLPFALEGGTAGTLATIDALFLGTDIATTDTGWRNKVTSNGGLEVLRLYDALETAYFTAQTVHVLKNGLSSLTDALTRWKNTTRSADEIAAIEGNVGKIVVRADEVAGKTTSWLGSISYSDEIIKTADEINAFWKSKGYVNPPYKANVVVHQFKLTKNTKFVKVYDGIKSNEYGQFLMKLEDVTNANGSFLSATEIKDKYALDFLPKYVADAEIPANTFMNCGIAGKIEGWGSGGGLQFDLNGAIVGDFKFRCNLLK